MEPVSEVLFEALTLNTPLLGTFVKTNLIFWSLR